MGLSRYLAKLGALVGSDGKIPAAGLAVGAAGVREWTALNLVGGTSTWVKLCTVSGSQNDRLTIQLTGSNGFSAGDDNIAGGSAIYITIGNDASANNLMTNVVNSSSTFPLVTACYAVKGATDFIWDLWIQVQPYSRVLALAYGNLGIITNIYSDTTQSTKPTGGYDKKVGRNVTSLTPGAILQVVSAVNTTELILNSANYNTWYDSGTQATITPSSTSSKVLVLVQQSHFHDATGAQGTGNKLMRNGVDITGENGFTSSYTGISNRIHGYTGKVFLDSPASVAALTYKVRVSCWANTGNAWFQYGNAQSPSSITLLEVAA